LTPLIFSAMIGGTPPEVAVVPALLAAALSLSAPRLRDLPEAEALQGRWMATSLSINGTADAQWAGLEYEFLPGGRWVIYRDGRPLAEANRTYIADPKTRPATIDLTEGANGKPYPGVYKVEKDVLSLSFHTGGGDRPSDFSGGPGLMTLVMQRVKEKK
jgi:uncharacterized protein (TIGR03067 family)